LLACAQEHDAKKEEKPQAANDTRLGTVVEDHETPKDVAAASSGSPMLGKPGAAKPKGSKCHRLVNCIRSKNGSMLQQMVIVLKHAFLFHRLSSFSLFTLILEAVQVLQLLICCTGENNQ